MAEKINIVFDAKMEVSQIRGAVQELQKNLSSISMPKNLGEELESRLNRLNKELDNFELASSKAITSLKEAKTVTSSFEKLSTLTSQVKQTLGKIGQGLDINPEKFFPKDIEEKINAANNALKQYNSTIKAGSDELKSQKSQLEDINKAIQEQEKKLKTSQTKMNKKQSETKEKELIASSLVDEFKKTSSSRKGQITRSKNRINELNEEKKALQDYEKALNNLTKAEQAAKKAKENPLAKQETKDRTAQELKDAQSAYKAASSAAEKYLKTKRTLSDVELDIDKENNNIKQQNAVMNNATTAAEKAKQAYTSAKASLESYSNEVQEDKNALELLKQEQEQLTEAIQQTETSIQSGAMNQLAQAFKEIGITIDPTTASMEDIQKILSQLSASAVEQLKQSLEKAGVNAKNLDLGLEKVGQKEQELRGTAEAAWQMANELEQVKSQVQYFFSLVNVAQLLRKAFWGVYNTVKELDAVMTETAVVTDFSVSDMWDKLPEYTEQAKALGVATKDLYAATTLYYQQGLDTNASMAAGVETMKMARIAGMNAAEATDAMTAALRGFNMEVNETNAQKVNNVYSKLAAITASDTEEIATAMSKTASIASSVGAEFENIAVFLAQGIETTRESADAIGTAMKTVLARFNELTKDPAEIMEVDGEIVDANKVDAALKSVGISLLDVNNQFRDADEVLLEVAQKWDSMTLMQQRYIATQAAGSRQQSRFIAMMSDYNRTLELQSAAYNAEGAAQAQYEKTLESLDAKLNKLKDTWDEFILGITNSDIIKGAVDALSGLLNIINKMTNAPGIFGGVLKSLMAFGVFKGGKALFGKGGIMSRFFDASMIAKEAAKSGQRASEVFAENFKKFKKIDSKNFIQEGQKIGSYYSIGIKNGLSLNKKTNNLINLDFQSIFNEMDEMEIIGNEIDSIIEKMSNPDLSLEEYNDLDKKLYSLGSQYHEVNSSINGLNTAQLGLLKTQVDSSKITTTELGLMNSKQLSLYANAIAEGNEATATKLATDAKAKKIALEKGGIAALLTKIGLTAKGNIQQGTETILTWEQVKALIAETIAQQGVNSAMLIGLGIIGAIVVVVGLLVASIAAVVKAYQNWAEQGDLAAQKTQAMAERAKEAKEEYDNLKDALDSLKEQQKTIDSLGKGTTEWKMAVAELNQQILDLLKTYPFLAEFIKNDGGVLTIDSEGYDEILGTQAQTVKNAQASAAASTIAEQFIKKGQNDDDESKVYNEYFNKLKNITQDMYLTPTYTGNQQQMANKYPSSSNATEKIPVVNLERASIDNLVDLYNKGKLTKEDVETALINGQNGIAPGGEEWETQINQIMGLIPQVAQGLTEVANAASLNAQILVQSANDLEGYSDDAANFISKYVAGDLENRTWKDENGNIVKSSNDEAVWSNYEKMLEDQYSGYDVQISNKGGTNATITRTKDGVTEYMQSNGSFSTTKAINAVGQEYVFQTVSNYKKAQLTDDDKKMAENYEHLSDKNKDYMDLILSSGLEVTSEELKGIFDKEGKLVEDSFQTLINRYEQAYGDIYLNRSGTQFKQETENASVAGTSAVQAITSIAAGEGVQNEQELLSTLEQVDGLYDELGNAAQEWAVVSNKGVIEQMSYLTALSQQQYQNKQETIDKAKEERQTILDAITALEGIKPGEGGYEYAQARIKELRKSLTSTDWVLDIEVTDNFDDIMSSTQALISSFDKITEAAELLGEGFTVSADDAQALSDTFPGILENATIIADGQIKLDKEVSESKLGTAEETIKANGEAQKAIILQDKARLDAKIKAKETELVVVEKALASESEAHQAQLLADLANQEGFTNEIAQIEQDEVENNLNALKAKGVNTTTYGNYELKVDEEVAKKGAEIYQADVKEHAEAENAKVADLRGFLTSLADAAKKFITGDWEGAKAAFKGAFATGAYTAEGPTPKEIEAAINNSDIKDKFEIVKNTDGKLNVTKTLQNYYSSNVAELEDMRNKSAQLNDQIAIIDAQMNEAIYKLNNPGDNKDKGTNSKEKDKDFDYDEYFNQQKKLAKLQADRNTLEREYDKLLEAEIVDLKTLEENQKKQVENLEQQLEIEEKMRDSRINRMNQLEKENPNFSKALWYDDELGTLQIDEAEMEKIGNMSEEDIDAFNEYYDKMNEHNDAQLDEFENILELTESITELTVAGTTKLNETFNLNEKIKRIESDLVNIEAERNLLMEDANANSKAILEKYAKEKQLLQDQLDVQKALNEESIKQHEQNLAIAQEADVMDFITDLGNGQFSINYELFNEQNKDMQDAILKTVDILNESGDTVQETTEAYNDAAQAVIDFKNELKEQSIDFFNQVKDALIESYQRQIDNLSKINDTMNESNANIISAMRENIELQRQERTNAETEQSIEDKQIQLAYLRQDTTGANQLAIKQLEEEIANDQQSYTDTLIDQKINELEDQNTKAFEQRQAQIDIMSDQLETMQKTGEINDKVQTIINNGLDVTAGKIDENSQLATLIKDANDWSGLSEEKQKDLLLNLSNAAQAYLSYIDQYNKVGSSGSKYQIGDDVTEQMGLSNTGATARVSGEGLVTITTADGTRRTIESVETNLLGDIDLTTASDKMYTAADARQALRYAEGISTAAQKKNIESNFGFYDYDDDGQITTDDAQNMLRAAAQLDDVWDTSDYKEILQLINDKKYSGLYDFDKDGKVINDEDMKIFINEYFGKAKPKKFASGGIANFTGPAWLDGTKSKPELVLNAQDTKNFIQLKDVLSSVMKNIGSNKTDEKTGDTYYEIHIDVEKLTSDYDVDDVAKRVQQIIVSDANYRNVNLINRLR